MFSQRFIGDRACRSETLGRGPFRKIARIWTTNFRKWGLLARNETKVGPLGMARQDESRCGTRGLPRLPKCRPCRHFGRFTRTETLEQTWNFEEHTRSPRHSLAPLPLASLLWGNSELLEADSQKGGRKVGPSSGGRGRPNFGRSRPDGLGRTWMQPTLFDAAEPNWGVRWCRRRRCPSKSELCETGSGRRHTSGFGPIFRRPPSMS